MESSTSSIARPNCPHCGHSQSWRIQYKYGYCRQHEEEVGDAIAWFDPPGRAAPEHTGGFVTAGGAVGAPCEACGRRADAALWFQDNVVHRVEMMIVR
jgi:hypothetical protein